MTFARRLLALLLVSLALVRPAAASDWSDIWFNPVESGWGVNFIQSNNFIFATFFVYGPDNQPFWYSAQLTRNDTGSWAGPVYQTGGTYFGSPWTTSNNSVNQVGTATFTPTTSFAGTLAYSVNSVNVTKSIQRQTLTAIPLGGKYSGAYVSTFTSCANPANNGPATYYTNLTVTQIAGGALTLAFESSDPITMTGNYIQNGLLYRVPNATYTFNSKTMAASFSEVKATSQGIEGTWTADVSSVYAGCIESGVFSALYITN